MKTPTEYDSNPFEHSLPHRDATVLPIDLPLHANEGVHQVAVGSDAVFAVTTHGRCFAWGSRLHGRLGANEADEELKLLVPALAGRLGIGSRAACLPCRAGHLPYTRMPERIDSLQRRIVGLACSDLHCLALSAEGEVFAWGSASLGRLGLGSEALSLVNGEATQPMPVKRLQGCYIVQVVCSKANSGCLSIAGDIFTWGATCYGLASCPGSGCAQEEPGLLLGATPDANRITSLAMGKLHALALSVMSLESSAAPFTAFYLLFLTSVR